MRSFFEWLFRSLGSSTSATPWRSSVTARCVRWGSSCDDPAAKDSDLLWFGMVEPRTKAAAWARGSWAGRTK